MTEFNGTQAALALLGQIGQIERGNPLSAATAAAWFDFAEVLHVYSAKRQNECWAMMPDPEKHAINVHRERNLAETVAEHLFRMGMRVRR